MEAAGAGVGDAERRLARAACGTPQTVAEGLHREILRDSRPIKGRAVSAGIAEGKDGEGLWGEVLECVVSVAHVGERSGSWAHPVRQEIKW